MQKKKDSEYIIELYCCTSVYPSYNFSIPLKCWLESDKTFQEAMSYVFVILIRIDKGMNNEISNTCSLYHVPIFKILTIDWKDKRIKLVYIKQ